MPDSGPPTLNQLNQLLSSIRDLSGEIAELREQLTAQKTRNRVMTALATLMLVALIAVGLVAYGNRETVKEIQHSRAERTMIDCVRENLSIQADRNAFVGSILTFAEDPEHLDADQQLALANYADAVALAKPYRDCSEAGIAAYFDSLPDDPATTTVADVP